MVYGSSFQHFIGDTWFYLLKKYKKSHIVIQRITKYAYLCGVVG